MAEENILKKDLQEVLREMSKAPGGSPTQQRPVTPGGILGGPRDVGPGVVDPATGVRTRRDSAIELFRFYAYGEEKPPRPIPAPPPDTKKVTVTDLGLTTSEKFKRKAAKQAGKPVTQTQLKKTIKKAIRQVTIGVMTRPPGSKPPVHLAKNLPIAIEMAAERARRRVEAEIIRDALQKAFGVPGAKSIPELETSSRVSISREEQKYLNYLQRRIQDAVEAKKAAESWREFWRTGLSQSTTEATKGADARTLEGRQVAERTRLSREKTEKSLIDKSKPPVMPRAPIGAIPPIMPGGGLLDMTK